jgi:sugar phosphate isomerase/epimerase
LIGQHPPDTIQARQGAERFTSWQGKEIGSMNAASISRRQFLEGGFAWGAVFYAGKALGASVQKSGKPEAGKIGDFKISLAEWSLNKSLFGHKIDNLDFPKIARQEYGIEAVEFVDQFFKDKAQDSVYLKDLKKRASDEGVTCVLIMIDTAGDIGAEKAEQREKAVENHKRWVDAAAALGCHAIRINTGHHYSATEVGPVAEACSVLTDYGIKNRISIICENHGGPSSDPDALLALIKAVGKPEFGTLPDFGNFPQADGKYTIDVYDAIARMMPHARGVSAKSYDFDDKGQETKLDYARILKIVSDAGYHGFIGIEYEGRRMSEADGIRATKRLLESLRGSDYRPSA